MRSPASRLYAIARQCMRSAASVALTLLGLVFVTFAVGRLIPIDPVVAVIGEKAPQETYDKMFKELGLDRPVYEQFFAYVSKLLHGDFGNSVFTGRPVLQDLGNVFPATLELATIGILIGVLVGVPLGVIGAAKSGRWPDHIIRVLSLAGYSVPVFWLGIVLLLVFYGKLEWVAGPGRIDIAYDGLVDERSGILTIDALREGNMEVFRNAISHMILPSMLLGLFSLAYISRMTRSFMLTQLNQEYVTLARAKGATERAVIWRHALKNARVQIITVCFLSYGFLLEGAVLTETVFSWPGLGLYMTNALFNADLNAVIGGTILIGAVFILLNALADVVYRFADPRTA
ncbi:putative D,D-dipeptide ABC transporter membrane subunit DdpB [Hyphomicrobiales bacterium]|nr:putative D,D-dipeptide ABC transporter membrane subunit DdpB [Hyphomicrobiales bacterium]CAH1697311.1 putative D,D-dipeptide ABC transporter membrane subunit DdpB [Hyphomicrobiales bacterium]CAI0345497.1 putative D,D-dipeptide ABC transporter membrane subunit DdpB [Hyphomicrobiales bacterium]